MVTVAYSENSNFWTTFYDYENTNGDTPEMFGELNNNFFSIIDGIIYHHDTNSTRNFVYDRQSTSKITMIGNIDPESNKIPQYLEQDSDLPWSIVKFETYRGQETNMNFRHFRTYEDVHCASVMRDINSNAMQAGQVAILHGDRMRDKTFEITVETDEVVENTLYKMGVTYSESKR